MAISFQNPFANDANLVNYFKMDGDDNFTANNITYVDGKINQSANFNGTNSNITYTGSQLNNFSFSFWIKTTQTTVNTSIVIRSDALGWLLAQTKNPDTNNMDVFLTTTGKVMVTFYNNSTSTDCVGTTTVNDGKWHNVIFTRNGSTGKLYVDGVLNTTKTNMHTIYIANQYCYFGSHYAARHWYNGQMDEVMIFTKVLSDGEIQRLYESYLLLSKFGEFLPTQNTLNLYRFNGNSVNSIGNVSSTDSNITYVPGRYGQCANFNGTNSKISYTGSELNNFTISLWLKKTINKNSYLIIQSTSTTNETSLTTSSDGVVKFQLWANTNGSKVVSSTFALDINKWYNVIGTRSGSIIKLYINGQFINMLDTGYTFTVGNYFKTIGSHQSNVEWFNGQMDELIIENKVWSDNEVRKYYTNSLGRFAIL